jgi:hypothetical protein
MEGGRQSMALRKLRLLCADGDKTLAEWNTETTTPEQLHQIELEFEEKMRQGFFAADITDGRNILIHKFDRNADTLLIPRVQGG